MPMAGDFAFSTSKIDAEEIKVLRFTATEAISQCFVYDIELASFEVDVAFDDIVGEPGTLEIHTAHGQRYIHGIISRWEEVGTNKAITYYSARLVPRVWTLTLTRQSRIFQKLSTPDIIKQVLEGAEIPSNMYRFSLVGTYEPRLYCVQYRETDYDFISRMMEEEGIFFFFEHTEEGHVLVIGDTPDTHQELPEDPILRYRESDAGMLSEETVTGLRYARTLRTGAIALKEFDFKKPKLALESKSEEKSEKEKKFLSYDYPGEYHIQKLGDRLAKVRLEEERAESFLGTAETDCRRIETGWKFALEDHPNEDLNTELLIVRAWHVGEQPHAGGGSGGDGKVKVWHSHFEVIPYAVPFRPARLTPRPRIDGPQTAVVVGPKGEEIHCDEHGRIKVKFHWDRNKNDDDTASCWIRVSQPWGGSGYGGMFIPRVGQEVVVEFMEGDPDRPLITGRVYNAENPPPYELPAGKTVSAMKSSSSPGGDGANELRFEDKKGSEHFLIQAQKDQDIYVKNDHREWIGRDQHGVVTRDRLTKVERDDHVLIERDDLTDVTRDQSLKVGGKQMIEIVGTRTLKVTGNVHETFGGSFSHAVGGNYFLKTTKLVIDCSGEITLKVGGNFVKIDSSGVTIVGTKINLNSGGSAGTGKAVNAVPVVKPQKAALASSAGAGGKATGGSSSGSGSGHRDERPSHKEPEKGSAAQKELKWIEFELVDKDKNPVAGEPYEVELPNKKITTGTTGADGLVRIEGVEPGSCKIRFPRLDKNAWKKV